MQKNIIKLINSQNFEDIVLGINLTKGFSLKQYTKLFKNFKGWISKTHEFIVIETNGYEHHLTKTGLFLSYNLNINTPSDFFEKFKDWYCINLQDEKD